MGNLSKLALCLAAASSALASPAPSAQIVHPSMNSILITEENTINSTGVQHSVMQASNPLAVVIKNSFSGSSQLYTYVSGMDTSGNVILLSASGSWYYPPSASGGVPVELPDSANVAIPLGAVGTNTSVTLPSFCNSCRFWIAEGKLKFFTVSTGNGGTGLVQPAAVNRLDPSAGINWGFVEFNYVNDVYANLSFVDFAGLVMGMALKTVDGAWQIVKGLKAGAITTICNGLAAQHNSDGQPWDELCQYGDSGEALRVLSPNLYISANANKFSGYYDSYIDSVWSYYQTHTLTINTQGAAGNVACTVSASTNTMSCAGDNRAYAKPTAHDIFSCSDGPFNIQSGVVRDIAV